METPNDLLGALRQTVREAESTESAPPRRSNNLESTLEAALQAVASGAPASGLQAIATQRQRLEAARADLEAHAVDVPAETTAARIVQRLRGLYARNGEALTTFETAVRTCDAAAAAQGADALRAITVDLFDCHDAWRAEMSLMEQEAGAVVMVPPLYGRLYEACEKTALGQMPVEAWRAVFESVEGSVHDTQRRLDDGLAVMGAALTSDAYASSIATEVQAGFNEIAAGLQRMRDFLGAREISALNDGWTRLVSGHVRTQKALHTLLASQGAGSDVVILEDE